MPIDRKMDEEAALHFKKWIVTQPLRAVLMRLMNMESVIKS